MKTYLSIDVDYFTYHFHEPTMAQFFKRILRLDVPTFIVKDHQHLTHHADQYDYEQLVNIDFHSDLTDAIDIDGIPHDYKLINNKKDKYKPEEFECGTWTNFCKKRTNAELVWCYPDQLCYEHDGQCLSSMYEDFGTKIQRKFIDRFWKEGSRNNYHNWYSAKRRKGYKDIFSNEILAVGIALSPDWSKDLAEYYFLVNVFPKLIEAGAEVDIDMEKYYKNYLETKVDNHLW